jgi:hypothetical protein
VVFETVLANFGEFTIHELRGCKSELHTTRSQKRKLRIFEPSRGFYIPLGIALKNPLLPLPIPPLVTQSSSKMP